MGVLHKLSKDYWDGFILGTLLSESKLRRLMKKKRHKKEQVVQQKVQQKILTVGYLQNYVSELNKSFPDANFVLGKEVVDGRIIYVVDYLNGKIKIVGFPQYYDLERGKVYFSRDAILQDKTPKEKILRFLSNFRVLNRRAFKPNLNSPT